MKFQGKINAKIKLFILKIKIIKTILFKLKKSISKQLVKLYLNELGLLKIKI